MGLQGGASASIQGAVTPKPTEMPRDMSSNNNSAATSPSAPRLSSAQTAADSDRHTRAADIPIPMAPPHPYPYVSQPAAPFHGAPPASPMGALLHPHLLSPSPVVLSSPTLNPGLIPVDPNVLFLYQQAAAMQHCVNSGGSGCEPPPSSPVFDPSRLPIFPSSAPMMAVSPNNNPLSSPALNPAIPGSPTTNTFSSQQQQLNAEWSRHYMQLNSYQQQRAAGYLHTGIPILWQNQVPPASPVDAHYSGVALSPDPEDPSKRQTQSECCQSSTLLASEVTDALEEAGTPTNGDGGIHPKANPRLVDTVLDAKTLTEQLLEEFSIERAAEILTTALTLLGRTPQDTDCLDGSIQLISTSLPSVKLVHPDEFRNPSTFLKIYGDPLCFAKNGPLPKKGRNGNWECCKCTNVNFPRRFRCNMCGSTRDEEGDRVVADYARQVYDRYLLVYRNQHQQQDEQRLENGIPSLPISGSLQLPEHKGGSSAASNRSTSGGGPASPRSGDRRPGGASMSNRSQYSNTLKPQSRPLSGRTSKQTDVEQ